MRRNPRALRANAMQEGVNGPAKLLSEVTGPVRASSWSFGGRRRQISFTGSKALNARSGLQPIRLSQCRSIGRQGRSPLIHAISLLRRLGEAEDLSTGRRSAGTECRASPFGTGLYSPPSLTLRRGPRAPSPPLRVLAWRSRSLLTRPGFCIQFASFRASSTRLPRKVRIGLGSFSVLEIDILPDSGASG